MSDSNTITEFNADIAEGIIGIHSLPDATSGHTSEHGYYFYGTGDKLPDSRGLKSSTSQLKEKKDGVVTQETNYVFGKTLQEARVIAKNLVAVTQDNDLMKKSIVAFDLVDRLEILWELRDHHSGDNWRDVLNHLQGVLVKEKFELLSVEMVSGIEQIVSLLIQSYVSVSDLRDTLEILSRSGLNAWRPITGAKGEGLGC